MAGAVFALTTLSLSASPAFADAGVELYGSESMSSGDLFKLLDRSLGSKFNSLIVTIGGCFTNDFTRHGSASAVARSGKKFALLTATNELCGSAGSRGSQAGNFFVQGISKGFDRRTTADGLPGTVQQGFDAGAARIRREAGNRPGGKEPSTPTLTATGGGEQIRLGQDAASFHAVLLSGSPHTCADWRDLHETYQVLRESGYPAKDIVVLFGHGRRNADGTPELLKEDGTPGPSVLSLTEKGCDYSKEEDQNGKPEQVRLTAATYANLQKALEDLKAMAAASPNEQYFIWSGSHNVVMASDRVALAPPRRPDRSFRPFEPPASQSEMPIALQSNVLSPLGSMTANVASDSQTYCTYGTGVSMPVAFVPSDQNGDALPAIGKALASLPLMAPGGATTPSNSGSPETAPNADKPQSTAPPSGGQRTATPQGGNTPVPPGSPPSGSTPSGPGSATSRSDAQPDESRELAKAAEALFRLMQKRPQEPSIPSGTTPPEEESILDEIKEVINMGAGSELTYDERMAREFADWLKARSKNVLTRDPSGLTPMERFVIYHQYLKELREARQSLGGSADNSAVFDEAIRKLKAQRESQPPPSRAAGVPPAGSNVPRVKITSNAEFGSTSPGASLEQVPAPESGTQISPEMLKPAWERPNAWPTPPDAGNEAGKTVGDKSAPGEKPASGVQSSLQSQTIEKSTPKVEPGDKTAASGAAAYPEKAEGAVTITFKVVESVLQGGSQAPEIREHTTKFATKVTAPEPAVPKPGQTKTEKAKLDKGYDRSPVTCTTGADGRCKAQVPADELETYGLPALTAATEPLDKTAARAVDNGGASRNYSVELARAGTAGVVIQKNSAKPASALLVALKDMPPGVQVQRSDFRIGNKAYTRVAFTGPTALTTEAAKKFAESLGKDAQIDQCGEKAPGPPLGMTPVSFSALNSELPQATVALRQSADHGGIKR